MTKNTAKKTQTVKKTKQNIFKLTPGDLKMIHGGRGVIITIGSGGGNVA